MEVLHNDLVDRYSEMETEELLRLQMAGGLTEGASKALDQVLDSRGIQPVEKEVIEAGIKQELANTPDLASLARRFVAQCLDALFALVVGAVTVFILGIDSQAGIIAGIVLYIIYLLFRDALPNGQSVGKLVMKISVVNKTTRKPCKHTESIVRNALLLFLGFIDCLTLGSRYRQRMGDMLANTIVVNERPRPAEAPDMADKSS